MRTLSVIAEMGSGGAETVVADLTARLVADRHETAVASSGGWRADRLREQGVRTVDVPLGDAGPAALARATVRLRAELRRHPVDLVHAHNIRATVAVAAAGQRPRVLTTVHGLAEPDYARAARLLRRCSDRVVAVSDDVGDRLSAAGLPATRLVVVENAAPEPASVSLADAAAVRAELGAGAEEPLVLCVARLAAPKRVDHLLAAWEQVPGAFLAVVGDGPERAALEAWARRLPRVRLLGDRRDVGRLLAAADLLVLPSDREGLPMSVLEGMAAGVPVVASAVGGLAALAGADHTVATLVPPGRPEDLARAVCSLLADPDRRLAQAAAARRLVAQRFSAARMWQAYAALYQELAARPP